MQTFNPPLPPTTSQDKPEFKILEAEFGDGYTQAAADGMNHIRKVASLNWDALTPAQADAIEGFILAHKGVDPFLYRLSDSPSLLKWTCKDYTRKRGTPNTLEATFRQSFVFA